jgi:hypothetical protein
LHAQTFQPSVLLSAALGITKTSMLRPKPTVIVLKPEEIEAARAVVIPIGDSDDKLKKLRAARLKM